MYRPYRQEAISSSHVQPHILRLVDSYHREHDIDRFLATPFLIVLLLLSAISYGSFFFSKIYGLISYKGVSYEWAGTVCDDHTYIHTYTVLYLYLYCSTYRIIVQKT